jgi:hypothetical protein
MALFKDPRAHDFALVKMAAIASDDQRVALRGQSSVVRLPASAQQVQSSPFCIA